MEEVIDIEDNIVDGQGLGLTVTIQLFGQNKGRYNTEAKVLLSGRLICPICKEDLKPMRHIYIEKCDATELLKHFSKEALFHQRFGIHTPCAPYQVYVTFIEPIIRGKQR